LKIIEKDLRKGFMKLVPDSLDDLWHLYNVIYKADEVYAYTSRSLKSDKENSRPKGGERVSVFMGITVESVSWDKFLGKLRVHGIICHAPDIIPSGHHTINISLNQPLTIVKKEWPKHLLDRLTEASESEKPLLILSIDDEGYAIAETKQYGIEVRIEERIKLPGKHESDKRAEATKGYFRQVLKNLTQIWSPNHNPIMIMGVGFVKNDFANFLAEETREVSKAVFDVKSVNNGGVAGIHEALRSGVLLKAEKQLRVVEETEVIEEVMRRLGKGENMVTYGIDEIEKALDVGAIQQLIVADNMLRDSDDQTRLCLEEIMHDVETKNGHVSVVSTEHEAGSKLLSLSGIVALLRFPLYREPKNLT
jgi:protein pelota